MTKQLFALIIFVYNDVDTVSLDIVRDDNIWLDAGLPEPVQHGLTTPPSTLGLH